MMTDSDSEDGSRPGSGVKARTVIHYDFDKQEEEVAPVDIDQVEYKTNWEKIEENQGMNNFDTCIATARVGHKIWRKVWLIKNSVNIISVDK